MQLYEIDKIKQYRGTDHIYNDMLDTMKAEAEKFAANFKDSPDNMSEWGHNYFCEKDGERLIFDLEKPHTHICQLCGKEYKSKRLDNVWTYFYRNEAILTLMKLALLYKLDHEEKHLDAFKNILGFYSDHYKEFVLHAKDKIIEDVNYDVGGAARLMPQGLNEAIIMIRITTSLEMLKGEIDEAFTQGVINNLLKPAVEVLRPQLIRIHNIPCWLNAGIGVVGLYTQDQELIDLVFEGEFGVNEQLKQGVTEDKFWYEGSMHYNFFLLEGVVNLLAFSKIYDQSFKEENTIKEMLKAAYYFAFDNDVFPNPNDGWPNINLKTYEYIYCTAAKIFGEDSEIGIIYKNILRHKSERGIIPLSVPYYYQNKISYEKLIYFPDINVEDAQALTRNSQCYENSYFGMLRNKNLNLFLKYGHRGPSHAHPDKMTIEVMVQDKVLTRDLSNSGYAAVLCNEWHRMSLSHNTVIIDGENQTSMEGGIVKAFDDNKCHTYVKDVYEGVDYTRNIDLKENGFEDVFIVESMQKHTYDFIFHSQAKLLSVLETQQADLGFNKNGYQHLQDVRKIVGLKEELLLEWDLQGTQLKSYINLEDKEIYIAQTYDNPVSQYRTALIIRSKSQKAVFNMRWDIID